MRRMLLPALVVVGVVQIPVFFHPIGTVPVSMVVPAAQAAPAAGDAGHLPAQPPASKRPWNTEFLAGLRGASPGHATSIELTRGKTAVGRLRHIERENGLPVYVSGDLDQPEPGRFFVQKQRSPGKAGEVVGVFEFPGSKTGYRIEPTGPNGSPELVELPLDQIICLALPKAETDETTSEIPPLNPNEVPNYPIPPYQGGIISLQSLPGVVPVAYLDFRGGYTPTWGGITYEKPNVSNDQIRDVWKRVAEDFMPFNINVTTDIRVYESAPETSRQRCVITPTSTAAPGAGGVAYLNSWNWNGDTPCWVFMVSGKACAEAVSHEIGHTLTLGHDGQNPSTGYYGGHGGGSVGWAPIMGVGYYQPVSQWSKGEYQSANNTENDLTKIVNNNNSVDYRGDDTGPILGSSRYLEIWSGNAASAQGVIETSGDTDAFQFTTTGGAVSLRANPVGDWANLAMMATIWSSADTLMASNNPQNTLAPFIATTLPAGTYTFRVTGAGRNNPLTDGFSSYGSLGYYSVTGTVANARVPNRFVLPENSPAGTVVGVVPFANPEGHPLSFLIASGNTSSAFAIDSNGKLTVANASALNYENLARTTQLPVQFQLLVNISDLADPARNETARRVVVSIQDVNEAPGTSSFTVSVLEHTQPGTSIGKVSGTDPDYFNTLVYRIVEGDPESNFSIKADTGDLSVAKDLARDVQPSYQLRVRVSDTAAPISLSSTSIVTINVLANTTGFTPGSVRYSVYENINGNLVSALTTSPSYPARPAFEKILTTFEGDRDRGDNYGSVIRGYLIPPTSGTYFFWIASDDNSDLYLSTSSSPSGISRIAYVSGEGNATGSREWGKYASQRSSGRSLTGGQAYYIEARHKEGGGGDNLAVAWTGPGLPGTNVISGLYLAPYSLNFYPAIADFTGFVRRDAFAGAKVGRIAASDPSPSDKITFSITAGDPENIFSIDNEGWLRVADAAALQATASPSFVLTIEVTDSGTPALSATGSATINVLEAADIAPSPIRREMFTNITGSVVANLTSNAKYPGRADLLVSLNEFGTDADVSDSYGSRVRAFVIPPDSGDYRFYIASDDASQLKFSLTENPAQATVIAQVSGYTDPNQWTKEAGQTSAIRTLVAGTRYYIEALHKEGTGGDHLAVAWTGPSFASPTVIDGAYLAPCDINTGPQFFSQVFTVPAAAPNGTVIAKLTALDSPLDTLAFQIVSGNESGTFELDPDGYLKLADNSAITSGTTSFSFTCAVQDGGMGGLSPLRSSQATITVNVGTSSNPLVWTGAGAANNWNDTNNWRGILPGPTNGLVFGSPLLQSNRNDLLTEVGWIQFTNGGFNLTGNPIALAAGITNAGSNTVSLGLTLASNQVFQSSSGNLLLAGSIANASNTLQIVANSLVRLAGPLSGPGALTKSGTSTLQLEGTHPFTGPTVITPASGAIPALEVVGYGDLDIGGSDLSLSGRMELGPHSATVGALSGTGTIYANGYYRGLTVGANGGSGAFFGSIQNSNTSGASPGTVLSVVKVGAGTQILGGTSTYAGETLVREGTLVAANSSALGTALGGTVVSAGATLALSNNASIASEPLLFGGQGQDGSGALRNESGFNTFNGPLTVSAPALIHPLQGRISLGGAWDTRGHSLTFLAEAGASAVVTGAIGGTGGLLKSGPGELYLYGANTYSGQTTVQEGLMVVTGSGLLASLVVQVDSSATLDVSGMAGGLVLGSGQLLQGNGQIQGPALVNGTVSPGVGLALGSLRFSSLSLRGTTVLKIGKTSEGLTNDLIVCSGTLSLGGTLTVNDVGPQPFAVGDSLKLFDSAVFAPEVFTNFNLPALPPNRAWDTSQLAVNGTLSVKDSEPATPPTLGVTIGANQMTISWPAEYTSFVLTGQTNAPGQGLGPDWYPVPGVSGNSIVIPLDPGVGSMYFRLVK